MFKDSSAVLETLRNPGQCWKAHGDEQGRQQWEVGLLVGEEGQPSAVSGHRLPEFGDKDSWKLRIGKARFSMSMSSPGKGILSIKEGSAKTLGMPQFWGQGWTKS